LDTRGKIVPLEQLAARLGEDRQWLAAVGKFDPLTLAQAERLAALSGKGKAVLAVVEPDKASLLPVQARAALVAALKSVQAVVVAEANALAHYPQLEIFQDDEGERKRSAEFAEHVKRRQTAK
jgi:hypothetical protein